MTQFFPVEHQATRISVTVESPRQDEVIDLLRLGSEFALALYPPESNFLLDVDELERPGVSVHIARNESGHAIGMAALVPWGTDVDELKRMFVHPDARGRGVATALLGAIENFARAHGVRRIVLETGTLHSDAQALYSRCGYSPIPQFGQYIGEKYSYCMAKTISP